MLVGIIGRKGSGKTTFSTFLSQNMSLPEYAFADPLKAYVHDLFGWEGDLLNDPLVKETPLFTDFVNVDQIELLLQKHFGMVNAPSKLWPSFRETLLDTLQEYGRGHPAAYNVLIYKISPRKAYQLIGTEVFQEVFGKNFWVDLAPTDNYIITDVRFEHEAQFIKDNGGTLISVSRPGVLEDEHSSEQGFKTAADYHINNYLGLVHLREQAELYGYLLQTPEAHVGHDEEKYFDDYTPDLQNFAIEGEKI